MDKWKQAYDLIVYGATPAGIGAAIAAARKGKELLLLEPSKHVGGMMTSGLGRTDIQSLQASGGIFREFAEGVLHYYTERFGEDSEQVTACRNGLFFEPHVAMAVLKQLLAAERGIGLHTECLLTRLDSDDGGPCRATFAVAPMGQELTVAAELVIDATYEGDLAAHMKAAYRVGRESRDEWGEEYAGKLYMDFHPSKEVFAGSSGEADDRVQAFNYRLCLTDRPDNQVPFVKPHTYNRDDYASLIADVREGRVNGIGDVLNMLPVPNGKTDSNNHHYCMCSSDLPEENAAYIEGDPEARRASIQRHRHYVQGLLWFLQHDSELPEAFRADALRWGHAADEFEDYDHFPPQLYVREARRLDGEYTFTENDARIAPGTRRAPVHADSVAVGDYPIDSHATRKREPAGNDVALEGFLSLAWLTAVYQIPYRCMIPKRVDRLIVPTAVSATHMGFGTIRMEPVWMQLGYAAGTAAALCLELGCEPRALPVDMLQDELLAVGQRITFFTDASAYARDGGELEQVAAEYFGAKGLFDSYTAALNEPLTVGEASRWITRIRELDGGRGMPALPAAHALLPSGVDMGPRLPRQEIQPDEYWAANPNLPKRHAAVWLAAIEREWDVRGDVTIRDDSDTVTRGNILACLYERIRQRRSRARAEAVAAERKLE